MNYSENRIQLHGKQPALRLQRLVLAVVRVTDCFLFEEHYSVISLCLHATVTAAALRPRARQLQQLLSIVFSVRCIHYTASSTVHSAKSNQLSDNKSAASSMGYTRIIT